MTRNRLETFSDSVFAIVITLLAFELRSPISDSIDNVKTLANLQTLAPAFLIFVLSFLTISIMWINHHYITNKIEHVTHRIVWSNTALLMFITMIPFATAFLGNNPNNQVALIVYSVVMLCASLSFTLLKALGVPKGVYTSSRETFKHIGIYTYTFAIVVAWFYPPLTYFVLLVPPLSYILPSKD